MKNNASLIYNFFLVIGDALALVGAFGGAYVLRVSIDHSPIPYPVHAHTYIRVFLVLLPFWILIFGLLGLYDSNIYEKRFSEAGRVLVGSFIGMLFVVFWNFLSAKPILPARSVPIIGFVLAFIFILVIRTLARAFRTLLFSYDIGITKVLIVGDTSATHELVDSLSDSRTSGYRVVGVVGSARENSIHHHIRYFSSFEQAITGLHNDTLNGIIQTKLYADEDKNREVLDFAQANHIVFRFVPGNDELFVGNIDVELFRASVPVIAVHQTALFGWGRIAKRLFDIVVGGIGFLIALPFMIIISLLIVIFDFGPIFFRDKRLTRFDSTIRIFKFRTMKKAYTNMSPEDGFAKMGKPELAKEYRDNGDQLSNDPRVSKLGAFLRISSLDELPQLINVIKGDISLVGPRALVPIELDKFPKKNLLLSVKSGLTGLAQVSGRRELSFEERRKLDIYYVQNWSFWLDITILIKTIRAVFSRRGAI